MQVLVVACKSGKHRSVAISALVHAALCSVIDLTDIVHLNVRDWPEASLKPDEPYRPCKPYRNLISAI